MASATTPTPVAKVRCPPPTLYCSAIEVLRVLPSLGISILLVAARLRHTRVPQIDFLTYLPAPVRRTSVSAALELSLSRSPSPSAPPFDSLLYILLGAHCLSGPADACCFPHPIRTACARAPPLHTDATASAPEV
eukprot:3524839-Rhodomonas_salina.1